MSTITYEQKALQAEQFLNAYDEYGVFYDDFVQTFNLSITQCIALRRLCDLAEKYATKLAQVESLDELFKIYYSNVDKQFR